MNLIITLNNQGGELDRVEADSEEAAAGALSLKLATDWTSLMPGDVIIVSEKV